MLHFASLICIYLEDDGTRVGIQRKHEEGWGGSELLQMTSNSDLSIQTPPPKNKGHVWRCPVSEV